jgi:site-specific recombinase XerD
VCLEGTLIHRRPVVAVYVRHARNCPQSAKGELFRGCDCPKWLRYSLAGRQVRKTANTRSWGQAEGAREALQKTLDGAPAGSGPSSSTLSQAADVYLLSKQSQGFGSSTSQKVRAQLGAFVAFMASRSKLFAQDITAQDLAEYRATWSTWKSGVTRQKANSLLRGFLTAIGRSDLLSALETIKLSREDKQRLKPRPFTEDEIARLLAQVPVTFPDATKAARLTALIRLMVSTGLAIRDAVQLERAAIVEGWLKIDRQKTGKAVNQRLDAGLVAELQAVTNGNLRYVFWSGTTVADNMTGPWTRDLRQLMKDTGVYVRGNLAHRFRDTFVDYLLGQGCDMTTIAALLGDSVAVTEKHYADLASARMRERLAAVPVRTW